MLCCIKLKSCIYSVVIIHITAHLSLSLLIQLLFSLFNLCNDLTLINVLKLHINIDIQIIKDRDICITTMCPYLIYYMFKKLEKAFFFLVSSSFYLCLYCNLQHDICDNSKPTIGVYTYTRTPVIRVLYQAN